MDIQKNINKEVLKSNEEKVEDLAKDAEDLEKAVEKDIEDKIEKVEEVNDAEAEPLDAKDGSGKAVKAVVASDKEFKEEQEREDVEFPEVKKSEFVTEKLKPFTEKLELNEAEDYESSDDLDEGIFGPKITSCLVYKGVGGLHCDYITDKGSRDDLKLKLKQVQDAGNYTNIQTMTYDSAKQLFKKSGKNIKQYLGKQLDGIADKAKAAQAKQDARDNADRDAAAKEGELQRKYVAQQKADREASRRAEKQSVDRYTSSLVARDKARNPGYQSSGFHWAESLGEDLNEADDYETSREGILESLRDYLLTELEESEFMDNLAWRASRKVSGYDPDWCVEEASPEYKEKQYEYIDALADDLMAMCPLEESLKENKLNESDRDDLRNDANSLSDYLSKNKLYCDLEDYDTGPLGIKIITFRVEGDWKHDHWYFNDLVKKWARENGREIFKIDENVVEEDGSDYYTADHEVYITDKETSDRLNSMRVLFAPKEESLNERRITNFECNYSFPKKLENALHAAGIEYSGVDKNGFYDGSLKIKNKEDENRALELVKGLGYDHAKLYRSYNDSTAWLVVKPVEYATRPFYGGSYDRKRKNNESIKEDLMGTAWGSNFQSDVYNALSKIAFKYYRKDVNITDDDWNEAIEWFMTHFFESDDNPFDESLKEAVAPDLINAIMWSYGCSKTEASKKAKSMDEERKKLLIKGFKDNAKKSFYSESLKESAEKFIITKVGDNKYALAKGNPPVVNTRKTITAKSPEEAKQILVDSGWYSEDELVIESLDESKLDEAIPREVAQALKNSSGLEIKNSGGTYYRVPGSTYNKYQYLDPKAALINSNVDYANAEFRKISKEEAINVFKNEPQNLLLIVKDYGRNSDKAIWFDKDGNRFGRVENVPLDVAPVKRDGTTISDTKYMTPKQLIGCASACYWTNQREVLRDPDVEKERRQNPESKYYDGDSVSSVVQATSPKYRDSYEFDNRSYRGLKMPSSYN